MISSLGFSKISSLISTSNKSLLTISKCNILMNDLRLKSGKSLESRLGIPEKPKKPLTPYFRFMKETRPNIQASNPTLHLTEVVKKVAVEWANVDANKKNKLMEDFKKEQSQYVIKKAQYDSKLTEDQKEDIKQLKIDIQERKGKLEQKKTLRLLGRPKKPASPFLLYLKECRKSYPQAENEKYVDWQKKVADRWNNLKDEDKQKYYKVVKAQSNEYSEALSKWEEKMVRAGNIEVVRQDMLVEPVKPKSTSTKVPKKAKKIVAE